LQGLPHIIEIFIDFYILGSIFETSEECYEEQRIDKRSFDVDSFEGISFLQGAELLLEY